MDKLNETLGILAAVVSTMDTISVTGIDNQDKFVGCANAIRSVISSLRQERAQKDAEAEPAGSSDSADVQEARNGLFDFPKLL